jgi:hypothetical protein
VEFVASHSNDRRSFRRQPHKRIFVRPGERDAYAMAFFDQDRSRIETECDFRGLPDHEGLSVFALE